MTPDALPAPGTDAASRPEAAAGSTRSLLASIAVGMLTLLLTLYLAFQSSELHSADMALREYQDLVNEHPQEKLYQAWKLFRYERVLNLPAPPLAQLDNYQKLAEATRELGDKRGAILKLLLDASVLHVVPPGIDEAWSRSRMVWMDSAHATPAPPGSLPPAGSKARAEAAADENVPHAYDSATAPISAPSANDDSCVESGVLARTGKDEAVVPGRTELDAYMKGIDCFLKTLKISAYDYNYPMWSAIYQTRNKVGLLTTWLLPGLYGLLGACVFLMRRMLQCDGSTRRVDVRALGVLAILLRLALGGLAGIIVGWFALPTGATSTSSALAISSLPFGVAFLAGFSIEGLFSLLDRLNRGAEFAGLSERRRGQSKPATG